MKQVGGRSQFFSGRAKMLSYVASASFGLSEASTNPIEVKRASDDPGGCGGYAEMSIPQLRGKLRFLPLDDLRALLAWELAHGERPPFVTMLTNRITAVQEA